TKIGLIIGVLVITAVVIAVLGLWQLHELNAQVQGIVDVTVRQQSLASQMEIDLLRAVRAEKNAVVSADDDESKKFTAESRKWEEAVAQSRSEFGKLLDQSGNAEEREALAEFDRHWQAFQKAEKDVL